MATLTATYSFALPTPGGDLNSWGDLLNANWENVEGLLSGVGVITPDLADGWAVDGTVIVATASEINFLDGVTSNVQSQINAKQPLNGSLNLISNATVTNAGVALLEDEDAEAQRETLGITDRLLPAGAVQYFAMDAAPSGWLKADGLAVSRSTYNDLFAAIGTTFGAGDGSSTFNLPDLRGEFIRGWDDGKGTDSGRSFATSQLDQMQRITGEFAGGRLFSGVAKQEGALSQGTVGFQDRPSDSGNTDNQSIKFDSGDSPNARVSTGTDGETRPRNVALLACIKY